MAWRSLHWAGINPALAVTPQVQASTEGALVDGLLQFARAVLQISCAKDGCEPHMTMLADSKHTSDMLALPLGRI